MSDDKGEIQISSSGCWCSSEVDVDVLLNSTKNWWIHLWTLLVTRVQLISAMCAKTQKRIDSFNAGLAVLTGERKCTFINNDNSLKTID